MVTTSSGPTTPTHERRRGYTAREQLATLLPLLGVWAVGIAVLALVLLRETDERAALFLDANHVAGLPWWVGAYAEVSTALWAVGLTVAVFGWFVVRTVGRGAAARFLGGAAGVSLLFFLDGVLRLHSRLLPDLLHTSKLVVVAGYGVAMVAWLGTSAPEIVRTRWQVLLAGLGTLGGSVVVDALLHPTGGLGLLLEDGLKFLGVLGWTTYLAVTTRDIVLSVLRPVRAPAGR